MADVSSSLKNWSTTLASNSPSGSTAVGTGLAPNLQQIQATVRQDLANAATDVASASSTDLGAVASNYVRITGTTTITSFGTVSAGIWKFVRFAGALTITHNATSLILPGAANITTVDGDTGLFVSEGSGNWRCIEYGGRATAAEIVAGTEATKAVTPAGFAGSKDVAGTDGYYKLPGGVILQWGQVTTDANGDATWTYPTAFSSAVLTVQGTSLNGDAALTVSLGTTTTTTVAVYTRNHADTQVSIAVSMFAIGV